MAHRICLYGFKEVIQVARLLIIDNFDSFTYNLVQMFQCYPLEISVFRSNAITVTQAQALGPDYLLISPGPKTPAQTGVSMPMIHAFHGQIPILGVCLGMQCINEVFGGRTVSAPLPMHGKTCRVQHDGNGIFKQIPSPFIAARYHSLASVIAEGPLAITATDDHQVIMGLSHRQIPVHGVQFHPESFLTEFGFRLVENFLRMGPLQFTESNNNHADMRAYQS